jgi:uncharacterized protein YyaL (SSP411 family)
VLDFLLRVAGESWAPEAGGIVRSALDAMAAGGIYDQVGGGFARYSVDRQWLIPHFEKMLYDNAQLARLYLWAWREFGVDEYRRIAVETLEYMLRDLRLPGGGFASAEDADSEGAEGRFYVWRRREFDEVAGDDAAIAGAVFGVTDDGNFEGFNHLHRARSVEEVAADSGLDPESVRMAVERTRRRLLERRSQRIRPGLDDKVIAAWNGLALRALAEAGAVFGDPRLLDAARRCGAFVLDELVVDGRLHRSWGKGRVAGIDGFLEDHGAVALGLLALYAATGEERWFAAGRRLADRVAADFVVDGTAAAVSSDAERLIAEPRALMDTPSPSGNSLAAEMFLTLASYTSQPEYRELAEAALRAAGVVMSRHPQGVGHGLGVAAGVVRGPKEVALIGPDAADLAATVWRRYRPHVALAVSRDGSEASTVPLLENRAVPGQTLAYVCEGFVCARPVATPEELEELIG